MKNLGKIVIEGSPKHWWQREIRIVFDILDEPPYAMLRTLQGKAKEWNVWLNPPEPCPEESKDKPLGRGEPI
jgi:hypothetical protein